MILSVIQIWRCSHATMKLLIIALKFNLRSRSTIKLQFYKYRDSVLFSLSQILTWYKVQWVVQSNGGPPAVMMDSDPQVGITDICRCPCSFCWKIHLLLFFYSSFSILLSLSPSFHCPCPPFFLLKGLLNKQSFSNYIFPFDPSFVSTLYKPWYFW